MTGPTPVDETSNDHERFRAEQLAQDHDAARQTADLTDAATRQFVNDLVDEGVVTPVAEQQVLVHNPSGEAFDSSTQLAVFHYGWMVAHGGNAEDG